MNSLTRVFWLFGRSGAGKTTLAQRLCKGLQDRSISVVWLDGDEIRSTLCSDLGFEPAARLENHRRIAEIAQLLTLQGLNVIVSTMAPEHQQRDMAAQILGQKLIWFYIHAPLDVCIQRDPKGIYQRAQKGQIKLLLNYPFEAPRLAERENYIDTVAQNVDGCYQGILEVARGALNNVSI